MRAKQVTFSKELAQIRQDYIYKINEKEPTIKLNALHDTLPVDDILIEIYDAVSKQQKGSQL